MPTLKRSTFMATLMLLLLTACGTAFQTTPTIPSTDQMIMPTQTSAPTTIQTHTQIKTPTPPTGKQPSSLVFPHITGDGGNFALLAGETITFTWENAPTGADKYEFVLIPLNLEPSFVLGIDFDDSDDVAISWNIPEHIAAELHATAYFPDDRKVELSFAPTIYSGDFPPAGVCSLIARNYPIEVYRLPDRTSEKFALLYPTVYAHVLEIAPNGWYRIDASVAELYSPPLGILPDTGLGNGAVRVAMNFDFSPASGDGWVNSDKGVLLIGSCPP